MTGESLRHSLRELRRERRVLQDARALHVRVGVTTARELEVTPQYRIGVAESLEHVVLAHLSETNN